MRHRLEPTRLLEQMSCTGDDLESAAGSHASHGGTIQIQHYRIPAADDEERGRLHPWQRVTGQVGTSATRDDSTHGFGYTGGGH
jgi:hypothetical protein